MRNKACLLLLSLVALFSMFQSCQTEQELNYARYYSNGKMLYEQHCQNCHNSDGKGLGALYPPLTDSVYIKTNKEQLSCIIKYGLKTPVTVSNKLYDGPMPENTELTDIDLAAIVTYITNSFGNKQGLYDVTNAGNDLKSCGINGNKQ